MVVSVKMVPSRPPPRWRRKKKEKAEDGHNTLLHQRALMLQLVALHLGPSSFSFHIHLHVYIYIHMYYIYTYTCTTYTLYIYNLSRSAFGPARLLLQSLVSAWACCGSGPAVAWSVSVCLPGPLRLCRTFLQ